MRRTRTAPRETTLLALLWRLPHRDPDAAVVAVQRRLRTGRYRLCGILRDAQHDLLG
jgi:hypothetical protein